MATSDRGSKAKTKKKAAPARKKAGADSPQLKKDPAFMKNIESAILGEYAKAARKADSHSSSASGAKKTVSSVSRVKASEPSKIIAPTKATKSTKAPKSTKAAKSAKAGDEHKELARELTSLIPDLDSEGLTFLIEQARVHIYNMRVMDLEAAGMDVDKASARAQSKRGAKAASAGESGSDEFTIKAASDGSAYDLVYNGKWKMFTGDEMLAMVRIVSSKDPVAQVGGRLYRWFLSERADVIGDLSLAGLADPRLKKLVALLKKTFVIKGAK